MARKLGRVLILQDCLSSSTAAMFFMFSFLLGVKVMFKVSISKPKSVIFCVGTNLAFVGFMANPNSCNKDTVANLLSKHS